MSSKWPAILVVCIVAAGVLAYPMLTRHPLDPAQQKLSEDLKRCENAMNQLIRQGASKTDEEREGVLLDGCKDALGGGRSTNSGLGASGVMYRKGLGRE